MYNFNAYQLGSDLLQNLQTCTYIEHEHSTLLRIINESVYEIN